jgi:hypothetical protein
MEIAINHANNSFYPIFIDVGVAGKRSLDEHARTSCLDVVAVEDQFTEELVLF